MVCKAQNSAQVAEVAKKASAAAISTAALLQTHPALALVSECELYERGGCGLGMRACGVVVGGAMHGRGKHREPHQCLCVFLLRVNARV